MATKFHMENEYPDKIPNIAAYHPDGALSKAFIAAYGIVLTKVQLDQIDIAVEKKT